ncbi:MAG: hypothetical protein ACOYLS_15540 [Polymorphobacter sp.]
MRKLTILGIAIALTGGSATAALAQAATAAAAITPGATIYDTAGNAIATVDSVSGGNVIVNTGTNKLAIPQASFGTSPKGPVIAATREQLDGAATQAATAAKAALMAQLVPGADIHGITGAAVIGKVKTVEGDTVLVETLKGEVRVPAAGFSSGPGGITLGMSAADFDAAVAAAKPGA